MTGFLIIIIADEIDDIVLLEQLGSKRGWTTWLLYFSITPKTKQKNDWWMIIRPELETKKKLSCLENTRILQEQFITFVCVCSRNQVMMDSKWDAIIRLTKLLSIYWISSIFLIVRTDGAGQHYAKTMNSDVLDTRSNSNFTNQNRMNQEHSLHKLTVNNIQHEMMILKHSDVSINAHTAKHRAHTITC